MDNLIPVELKDNSLAYSLSKEDRAFLFYRLNATAIENKDCITILKILGMEFCLISTMIVEC